MVAWIPSGQREDVPPKQIWGMESGWHGLGPTWSDAGPSVGIHLYRG